MNAKIYLQQQMTNDMDEMVKKFMITNPMKGTPMEGSMLLMAIGNMAGSFKESFTEGGHELQMTEQEVVTMVDEVSEKIINKYLEV